MNSNVRFRGLQDAIKLMQDTLRTNKPRRKPQQLQQSNPFIIRQNIAPSQVQLQQHPSHAANHFSQPFQRVPQNTQITERVQTSSETHTIVLQAIKNQSQKPVQQEPSTSNNLFGSRLRNQVFEKNMFSQHQAGNIFSQNPQEVKPNVQNQAGKSIFGGILAPDKEVLEEKKQMVSQPKEEVQKISSNCINNNTLQFTKELAKQVNSNHISLQNQNKIVNYLEINEDRSSFDNFKPNFNTFKDENLIEENKKHPSKIPNMELEKAQQKNESTVPAKNIQNQSTLFGAPKTEIETPQQTPKQSFFGRHRPDQVQSLFGNQPLTLQPSLFGNQQQPVVRALFQNQNPTVQSHQGLNFFRKQPNNSISNPNQTQNPANKKTTQNIFTTNRPLQTPTIQSSLKNQQGENLFSKPSVTIVPPQTTITPQLSLFSNPSQTATAPQAPKQGNIFSKSTPPQSQSQQNTGFFGSRPTIVPQKKPETQISESKSAGLFDSKPKTTGGLFSQSNTGLFKNTAGSLTVKPTGGLFGNNQPNQSVSSGTNIFGNQTSNTSKPKVGLFGNQTEENTVQNKQSRQQTKALQQEKPGPVSKQDVFPLSQPVPTGNIFGRGQQVPQQKPLTTDVTINSVTASSNPTSQPNTISTNNNPFANVMSKPNNMFGGLNNNIFGSTGTSQNMFSNNQQPAGSSLFALGGPNVFAKKDDKNDDEDEGSEEDSDGEDNIQQSEEPQNKGQLKFNDYINTTVFCKLQASKFKVASTGKLVERAVISLQKFPDNDPTLYMIVRYSNKTVAYYGILTHASKVNVIPKKDGQNTVYISIEKIIQVDIQNQNKRSIELWRLLFKDSKETRDFIAECEKIIKNLPKPTEKN